MDLHLKDKVVLVTGGSRGIGLSIAEEFLNEGAKVFISSKTKEEVDTAVLGLKQKGVASGCVTDVTSVDQIKNMVEKCVSEFGKLDVLVNNAGVFMQKEFNKMTPEDWDLIFNVNMRGYAFVAQEAFKVMNESGSIINIASIAGFMGGSENAAYSASKAGVISLTKSLALAYAPKIRVNAVAPGLIDTPMVSDIIKNEQMMQWIMSKIPLKRKGVPIDIAKTVVFTASSATGFMTGATIVVDGGWLAG